MKELLERYSLRVLRIVAKQHLPNPCGVGSQVERRKVQKHYKYFLLRAPKSELIGALLPYMNSNAERVLDETVIWLKLNPRKSGKGSWEGRAAYNRRQWVSRRSVRQWIQTHPGEVEEIRRRHELEGTLR